ncbi:mechanosensitive ion channel family protein [Carboxylicivirga sp. RSCT41]|uniref:mechanosensitive ion channel family protein n=1 Tax=Carboxylicivirga agarovorans TaxID=3417570 RepID=UPI003D32CF64
MGVKKISLSLICYLSVILASAQMVSSEKADTTAAFKPVDVIEIPSKSADATRDINQIKRSLLKPEQLEKIKTGNSSTLNLIDSLIVQEKNIELTLFNKRHLINKRSVWNQRLQQLETIQERISLHLKQNEDLAMKAEAIGDTWSKIGRSISAEETDSVVKANIIEVVTKNDTLLNQLHQQRSILLEIQDKTISKSEQITSILERIENKLDQERHNIFARTKVDFSNLLNKNQYISAQKVLQKSLMIESRLLEDYMKDKHSEALLFIVILVSGMILFRQTRKAIIRKGILDIDSYYAQQFKLLLTAHYSTAFVLFIWLSALLFPNQPLLFKDGIRIIICIPLTILLYRLINKKLFSVIVILFFLIFVQSIINLFPPNHMAYRLYLLIAILLELFVMIRIKMVVKTNTFNSKLLSTLVNKFLILAIGIIVMVIILGLFGYIVLTELVVNVVLANAFSISLLFVSMLIVNGLLELLFSMERVKHLKVVQHYGEGVKNRLIQFVSIATPALVLYIILASVGFDEPVINAIKSSITYQFKFGEISFSIEDIIFLVLTLSLSIFLSNVVKVILEEDVLSRTKLGKGLPHTISLMAKYAIITIGVTFAFSVAGFRMENFAILIGAFGVGIGFGLQNIFNNLVSGFILLFERPIKIDDVIEVGQLRGRVRSIGIRSSVVRTFDGAEVIVPNGQLISNEVINWTHSDQIRRYEVFVGVAYGSDVEKVRGILEEQIKKHKDILDFPEPDVLFINMGDSSLDFRMLYWVSKVRQGINIQSDITQMVYDALNKEGISIPFPQRDIHIIKDKG